MHTQILRILERDLVLAQPLKTAKGAIGTRRVAYLEIESDGVCGVGEAAPLPGWGETWAECIDALNEAVKTGIPPSGQASRFAWDCAHADHAAQLARRSFQREFGGSKDRRAVPVNGTIGALGDQEVLDQARVLVNQGFDVIKFKVGALEPEQDIERILALRAQHPQIRIRIDANAAWDVSTAVELLCDLRNKLREQKLATLDYVEQPVPVGEERVFRKRWIEEKIGFRIAADESCVPFERALGLIRFRLFDVLVIKPMVVGSFERLRMMVSLAEENKMRWVFSSSVESAIARAAVGHLAAALECPEPCGLATGSWLANDVAELRIEGGKLQLPFTGYGLGFGAEDRTIPLWPTE